MAKKNKKHSFFTTLEETKQWLEKMKIDWYSIDPTTLSVSVNDTVDLRNKGLKFIPIQFSRTENFLISNNPLNSLEGCPDYVFGNFVCGQTNITTLKFMPKKIMGDIGISYNPKLISLESLEGCQTPMMISYNADNTVGLPILNQYLDENIIEAPFKLILPYIEAINIKEQKNRLENTILEPNIENHKSKLKI